MKYEPLIRKRFDVVSQHGDEFLCKCPYHEDTGRPNLYANGVKGLFLCHACGAKGKLVDEDMPEDWKGLLGRMRGLDMPPPEPQTYDNRWLQQFDNPTPYWSERGFSEQTIKRFQLGYDPIKDEGIIPVRDHHGTLVGAIRRRLDAADGPRYLYPRGFPLSRTLFGSWMLGAKHNKVAIVEGSLDAVACWNARVPALALLGSRLSQTQLRILHELDVQHLVLMLDNDTAGRDGTEQIMEDSWGFLISRGEYRTYWKAKDPADLAEKQIRKMFHSALRTSLKVD
jgi:DNA primase